MRVENSYHRKYMVSKSQIRFIRSLNHKKERRDTGCFLAEGNKLVEDTLPYFICPLLIATPEWMSAHPEAKAEEKICVSQAEIDRISLLKNPQEVLAIYRIPAFDFPENTPAKQLVLALDTIQDPGNLGTIVRLADWYGIEHILCSPETADLYNPKTVQATMGALSRVKVHYLNLPEYFSTVKNIPVYGTFINGNNIYESELTRNGILIMGNEGNGISPETEKFVTRKLRIPNYPQGRQTSESLNVAVATAIVCAEFRRR